jgi:hypothetical protein
VHQAHAIAGDGQALAQRQGGAQAFLEKGGVDALA